MRDSGLKACLHPILLQFEIVVEAPLADQPATLPNLRNHPIGASRIAASEFSRFLAACTSEPLSIPDCAIRRIHRDAEENHQGTPP
jgi:hypothetical protein